MKIESVNGSSLEDLYYGKLALKVGRNIIFVPENQKDLHSLEQIINKIKMEEINDRFRRQS